MLPITKRQMETSENHLKSNVAVACLILVSKRRKPLQPFVVKVLGPKADTVHLEM